MIHYFNSTIPDADVRVVGLEQHQDLPNSTEWEAIEDCAVQWQAEPDMREDCIASLGIRVNRVSANIMYTYVENKEPKSGRLEFSTSAPKFRDFELISELTPETNGGVCVSSVEIDLKNKTVTVS